MNGSGREVDSADGRGRISAAVQTLVREFVGARPRLTEDTDLFRDLGITGDDAREFLAAYSRSLGVDMADFIFPKYFGHEGALTPLQLIRLIFRSSSQRKAPIRIKDLVDAACRGRW